MLLVKTGVFVNNLRKIEPGLAEIVFGHRLLGSYKMKPQVV